LLILTGGKQQVTTCTNWFWTKDQNNDALPENVRASIYKWNGTSYDLVGDAWIHPTNGDRLTLAENYRYKAIPITDIENYITPSEQAWIACDKDITFVYKKEGDCPTPTCSIRIN